MIGIENEAEMLAEHEATKAAAEAAKRVLEAKREEEQNQISREIAAKAQAERVKQLWVHYNALAIAMTNEKRGVKAHAVPGELKIVATYDGMVVSSVDYRISFDTTYSKGYGVFQRGSKPIGLRMIIGAYGERTNYPQRKHGGFSYHKAAAALCNYVIETVMATKAAQKRTAHKHIVAAFKTAHHDTEYGVMRVEAGSGDRPLRVVLNTTREMTVEQADRLHAVLVEIGLIKVSP